MAANSVFQPVNERGWRAGFANLLRKENREWWGTRRWLVRIAIWSILLNGLLVTVLFATPPSSAGELFESKDITGLTLFFIMGGLALPIGVIIQAQDEIIEEKKLGTAAWILSKPVSRTAFILSKLIANALGTLIVMVVIQGVLAFTQLSIARGSLLP